MRGKFIILIIVFFLVPSVLAVGIGGNTGGTVTPVTPDNAPLVFTDSTARIWCPNDGTYYTAFYFGNPGSVVWDECMALFGWDVPLRQNYIFTGEKIRYFLLVYDADGIEEVTVQGSVRLALNGGTTETEVGACAQVTGPAGPGIPAQYDAMLPDGTPITTFDAATMAYYECTLIAQSGWTGEMEIKAKVQDVDGNIVYADESDYMYFNPDIQLDIKGGPVDFGTVTPGGDAYSNTIALQNVAIMDADGNYGGVLLDMYIAADDYFTDPANGNAICPTANGIPYYNFSYYATKGSIDSGSNNNWFPGIGASFISGSQEEELLCTANSDEYTTLPSYSGHVEDMCRIINWAHYASILAQGAEMSLTFQLDVPKPCIGSFSNGQFRFWGEVI